MILKLIIWNNYFIWYFFINYLITLLMWWRCFNINAVNKLQIFQSFVITTCRLFIWIVFFTSSIFSFLTDIDMSLVFFIEKIEIFRAYAGQNRRRNESSLTQKKESSIQTVIWLINWRANSHEKNKSSIDFRTAQKIMYWCKNRNQTLLHSKIT